MVDTCCRTVRATATSTPAFAGRSRPSITSPSTSAIATPAIARAVALVYEDDAGSVSEHTFAEFRARSNQLARVLAGLGIVRGDRVGIVLPQRPETAVAHLAAYKLGAVALPLSTLFGPEALEYRLRDAGAKIVVTDAENLDRVLAVSKGFARAHARDLGRPRRCRRRDRVRQGDRA